MFRIASVLLRKMQCREKYKFNVYNSIEYDNNIHEFIIKVNKIGLVYLFENKNFVRYCRNKIKKQILTKKDN